MLSTGKRSGVGVTVLKRTSHHPGCCRVRNMLSTGKKSGWGVLYLKEHIILGAVGLGICCLQVRGHGWGVLYLKEHLIILGAVGLGICCLQVRGHGWGVVKLCINFSIKEIFILWKYLLHSLNHFHIWQMSPQLSCGEICQKWMWHLTGNHYLDNGKKKWENNGINDIGLVPRP